MSDESLLPEPADDPDRKLLRDVKEVGWHVVKVFEQSDSPGWAFSIGLFHNYGQPEVLVVGLSGEVMHAMINTLGGAVRGGLALADGYRSDELLNDYTCELRRVAALWHRPLLGYASWFYRGRAFPVLQCLWPDRAGRLPHDPGFDSTLANWQPLLEHGDAEAARIQPILDSMNL